jgi:hypothetical protein
MKVVINICYGGFELSELAIAQLRGLGHHDPEGLPRWDRDLVSVVETLGNEANGDFARLRVIDVFEPFRICDYDGYETIETLSDLQESLIDPSIVGK